MHSEETLEPATCADCGEPTDLDSTLSFVISENKVLCFDCALRRGGRYDEDEGGWVVAPNVLGLIEAPLLLP